MKPKADKSSIQRVPINHKKAPPARNLTSARNLQFAKKKEMAIQLPLVTAEAYCIALVGSRFEFIAGQKQLSKRKIASLTKIMTLHCALKLCKFFNIDPQHEAVKVKKDAGTINGTRADLAEGDYILVEDLFYGLMLPSGNDAALCLADFFGKKILGLSSFKNVINNNKRVQLFVQYMNKTAKELKLNDTKFLNKLRKPTWTRQQRRPFVFLRHGEALPPRYRQSKIQKYNKHPDLSFKDIPKR
jgi:D-alanyl-D-alanine carboxypeptidase